jgi:DnaJ homolog subfamily A member 2
MAAQKFQTLQNAYSTLLDPDSRAAYDRYGPDGPSARMGGGGMGMDPDELFAQFFSFSMGGGGSGEGGFGGMGGPSGRPRRGEDSIIPYEVTLEDLYNGKTAHFNLEKNVVCGHCTGYVSDHLPLFSFLFFFAFFFLFLCFLCSMGFDEPRTIS